MIATQEFDQAMAVKTSFPRFQEYFQLTVQGLDEHSPATVGKMYVGKYFTSKGEFDEVFTVTLLRYLCVF
jgi:hypothetical protein